MKNFKVLFLLFGILFLFERCSVFKNKSKDETTTSATSISKTTQAEKTSVVDTSTTKTNETITTETSTPGGSVSAEYDTKKDFDSGPVIKQENGFVLITDFDKQTGKIKTTAIAPQKSTKRTENREINDKAQKFKVSDLTKVQVDTTKYRSEGTITAKKKDPVPFYLNSSYWLIWSVGLFAMFLFFLYKRRSNQQKE